MHLENLWEDWKVVLYHNLQCAKELLGFYHTHYFQFESILGFLNLSIQTIKFASKTNSSLHIEQNDKTLFNLHPSRKYLIKIKVDELHWEMPEEYCLNPHNFPAVIASLCKCTFIQLNSMIPLLIFNRTPALFCVIITLPFFCLLLSLYVHILHRSVPPKPCFEYISYKLQGFMPISTFLSHTYFNGMLCIYFHILLRATRLWMFLFCTETKNWQWEQLWVCETILEYIVLWQIKLVIHKV